MRSCDLDYSIEEFLGLFDGKMGRKKLLKDVVGMAPHLIWEVQGFFPGKILLIYISNAKNNAP